MDRYVFSKDNETGGPISPYTADRILYRGNQLDLAVYSRAELMGSDHKPVFGIFRAEVRIVDPVKKAVMSQMLLETVTSTEDGQSLVDKLKETPLSKALGESTCRFHRRSLWDCF